jgi:hypothetical protein
MIRAAHCAFWCIELEQFIIVGFATSFAQANHAVAVSRWIVILVVDKVNRSSVIQLPLPELQVASCKAKKLGIKRYLQ